MSARALQRVVVRMLYDAAFAEAVYASPEATLAGIHLKPHELTWLTTSDPRAWRTDRFRRSRSLTGLLDEYPASAALTAHDGSHVGRLDAFFSSAAFHEGIQARASLALVFGEWLASGAGAPSPSPWLTPVARLERCVARVRRDPLTLRPPAAGIPVHIAPAPRVAAIEVPQGTLHVMTQLQEELAARPGGATAALVQGGPLPVVLGAPRPPEHAVERWLVEMRLDAHDVAISEASEELFTILAAAEQRPTWDDALLVMQECGQSPNEAGETIADLISDGLLALSPPFGPRGSSV